MNAKDAGELRNALWARIMLVVRRYLRRRWCRLGRATLEDAEQESLVRLVGLSTAAGSGAPPDGLALTVAKHVAMEMVRASTRAARIRHPADRPPAGEANVSTASDDLEAGRLEIRAFLTECGLSQADVGLVLARVTEDLTIKELAAQRSLPVPVIWKKWRRLRARIRRKLDNALLLDPYAPWRCP